MPPKSQRTLSRSRDDYAASRCECGHLVYADEKPGGSCRWDLCQCTDHRPKAGGGDR